MLLTSLLIITACSTTVDDIAEINTAETSETVTEEIVDPEVSDDIADTPVEIVEAETSDETTDDTDDAPTEVVEPEASDEIAEVPDNAPAEIVEPEIVEPDIVEPNTDPELLSFTSENLAQFNGQNGQPTYFAYEGFVYDASESSAWTNGMHYGIEAGYDLTDDMQYSPHGPDEFDKVKLIGLLVD
jgi:predicted heme/steroid binding protein